MAARVDFVDGFDYYLTEAILGQKWFQMDAAGSGKSSMAISTGYGFLGVGAGGLKSYGQSLQVPSGGGLGRITVNGSSKSAMGVRISRASAADRNLFMTWGGDTNRTPNYKVVWKADGSFAVYNRNGALVGTTPIGAPLANHAYFIECQCDTLNPGSVWIAVDGAMIGTAIAGNYQGNAGVQGNAGFSLLGSGINPHPGVGTGFDLIGSTGPVMVVDDFFYTTYFSGDTLPLFFGPVDIKAISPTGQGALNAWDTESGAGSSSNWQHVDEVPVDTSDFVTTASSGNKDTYAITTPTPGTIQAYQFNVIAKRGVSGPSRLSFITAPSGSTTTTLQDLADGNMQLATSFTHYSGIVQGSGLTGANFGIQSAT